MAHYGLAWLGQPGLMSGQRTASSLKGSPELGRNKRVKKKRLETAKKENNKEVSVVFGCGCGCGNGNVDGTETDREIRSEGSYLKYLRRRFNSRLGGFSFLGFGALCCCLSAHSSARKKNTTYLFENWPRAEMKYECNAEQLNTKKKYE